MGVVPLPSHRNPGLHPWGQHRSVQPAGRAGVRGELLWLQNSGIFIHRLQSWAHSAALSHLTAAQLSQLYFSLESVFYGQQFVPDWEIKGFLYFPRNAFLLCLWGYDSLTPGCLCEHPTWILLLPLQQEEKISKDWNNWIIGKEFLSCSSPFCDQRKNMLEFSASASCR